MADAFSGVGTILSKSTDNSIFAPVAKVKSISGPDMKKEMIDVTTFDSTGGFREFIPSFKDAGNVALEVLFTREGYETLFDDFVDSTNPLLYWSIELNDGQGSGGANTLITFAGYISDLPMNVKFDDAVSFTFTIKISGELAISDAS